MVSRMKLIYKLFTPGPVAPSNDVLKAAATTVISHRSRDFHKLFEEVYEKLLRLVDLDDGLVALLSGSGTTAVDAMCWSLIARNDNVLVVSHGEFGYRMAETIARRGARVTILESNRPGEPVAVERVLQELESGKYNVLALVHTETSMGLAYRVLRDVARKASSQGVKVLVDVVSSLAGEEFSFKWGVTAIAGAAHKAIAALPGVSFVIASTEAIKDAIRNSKETPLALDLSRYAEFRRRSETPFTPPVNLLYALNTALDYILRRGVENYIRDHEQRARILYEKLPEIGFKPVVGDERYRSNTVAAFYTPIDAVAIKEQLYERGYIIATGMGRFKNRMIRIGVMGNIDTSDVELLVNNIREVVAGNIIHRQ